MKALLTAIKTKFDAATALAAIIPLQAEQITEGSTKPYSQYVLLGNPITLAFDRKFSQEEVRIQFNIYAVGLNTVLGYQEALHGVFDNVILTLTPTSGSEKHIESTRLFIQPPMYVGRDENDDETYLATSEYKFVTHRQEA